MQEDNTTPRPWKLEPARLDEILIVGDSATSDVARLAGPLTRKGANAGLILRAVNAHDALIEAVDTLLGVAMWARDNGAYPEAVNVMIYRSRLALLQAKGE